MKANTPSWKAVKSAVLPNLNVLVINSVEVGFIQKPKDTKTDKNSWRVFAGIGDKARLLGHRSTKSEAKRFLQSACFC